MFFTRKTRHPAYTDDDPRIVLALREVTEPRSRRWNFFVHGCAVECFLILLALLSDTDFGMRAQKPAKPDRRKQTTVLYIPRVKPPASQARATPPPPKNALATRHIPQVLDPQYPPVKVKIDLSAIEISVADDVDNQLPAVVRQQNGMLALLEVDDPKFARYTFTPPDWRMEEGVQDVSRKIRFSMTPLSRWPMVESLIAGGGISLQRYRVDALFDSDFSRCLEQEIRNHANAATGSGRVHTVQLAFNSSRSCGIDVLNVEYYPVP
jgi:hypothetical protein